MESCYFYDILVKAHDEAGHPGIRKTQRRIEVGYFWKGMKEDIANWVKSCHICQLHKLQNHLTYGQLQPLQTPKVN